MVPSFDGMFPVADPESQEASTMETQPPSGPTKALLAVAIMCSAVSFGALLFRPVGTDNWRLWLNIVALLLVIFTTIRLRRGARRTDA
jgi:hypothetical protein